MGNLGSSVGRQTRGVELLGLSETSRRRKKRAATGLCHRRSGLFATHALVTGPIALALCRLLLLSWCISVLADSVLKQGADLGCWGPRCKLSSLFV